MTEDTKANETVEDFASPMEKAKAGGYVEPEAPSHEDRVAAVVADLEHAMKHNGPVTIAVLAEVKDLLGVKDEVAPEGDAGTAGADAPAG